MITMELLHKADVELLDKALGCLWAQDELVGAEYYAFMRVEAAINDAANQTHEPGSPRWMLQPEER